MLPFASFSSQLSEKVELQLLLTSYKPIAFFFFISKILLVLNLLFFFLSTS